MRLFDKEKKHIADFMIEFETLAMKVEIDDMHAIFLLKKNVRSNIIKTILEYSFIAAPEILKKWKIVITLVRQRYRSTESRYDYRTRTEITYKDRGVFMEIRKFKDNYDKNGKPKYFNYNVYKHMAKDYKKSKKEKETRKCYKYKCDRVGHLVKDCRSG